MKQYLYRVTEIDDEGDPLDHGVLTVKSPDEKLKVTLEILLQKRLTRIGFWEPGETVPVRLYPITSRTTTGVNSTTKHFDMRVKVD